MTRDEGIEKLAREICAVDGLDPDTLVSSGQLYRLMNGRYVVPQGYQVQALWSVYREHAEIAFKYFEVRLKETRK